MGATIMGDRRVALILDVQGLTRLAFRPRTASGGRGDRGAEA
jgi:chemotaxis protein histidine kinase CheA